MTRFLIPENSKLGLLKKFLGNKLKLKEDQSIFIFLNNKTLNNLSTFGSSDVSVKELYEKNREEDLFLYIHYSELATFGAPN